jgi:hypothetical protein
MRPDPFEEAPVRDASDWQPRRSGSRVVVRRHLPESIQDLTKHGISRPLHSSQRPVRPFHVAEVPALFSQRVAHAALRAAVFPFVQPCELLELWRLGHGGGTQSRLAPPGLVRQTSADGAGLTGVPLMISWYAAAGRPRRPAARWRAPAPVRENAGGSGLRRGGSQPGSHHRRGPMTRRGPAGCPSWSCCSVRQPAAGRAPPSPAARGAGPRRPTTIRSRPTRSLRRPMFRR